MGKYKGREYWTLEVCIKDASTYRSKSEWQKHSPSAYGKALKNKWLDECSKHMIQLRKPDGYWNINQCKKDALNYKTKVEWQKLSTSSYFIARKNGWVIECCSHMSKQKKPNGYWTKYNCINDAKKYTCRSEWENNSSTAYSTALKNKWLDECCTHMIRKNPLILRLIYSFEFSDKSVYVGLTSDSKRRQNAHLIDPNSVVYIHLNNNLNITYHYKELTDYVNEKTASLLETEFLENYKSNGWNILNRTKTGGLGGGRIVWTKNKCLNEAKKYLIISNWRKYSINSYQAAVRNKWIEECTLHMEKYKIKKPPIKKKFWTLDKCKIEALKYNKIKDLRQNASGAYHAIHKNKWSKICFLHIKNPN